MLKSSEHSVMPEGELSKWDNMRVPVELLHKMAAVNKF